MIFHHLQKKLILFIFKHFYENKTIFGNMKNMDGSVSPIVRVPGLEVWNRNFFVKVTRLLHENDKKYFIQSNLHCYLHIFPISPEGDECHANKTVRI